MRFVEYILDITIAVLVHIFRTVFPDASGRMVVGEEKKCTAIFQRTTICMVMDKYLYEANK